MIPLADQYTQHLEQQSREKDAKIEALEKQLADKEICIVALEKIVDFDTKRIKELEEAIKGPVF